MKKGRHTIECLCGYIATFEKAVWECPDCGRTWTFTSNGKKSQMGIPTKPGYELPKKVQP